MQCYHRLSAARETKYLPAILIFVSIIQPITYCFSLLNSGGKQQQIELTQMNLNTQVNTAN